MSQMQKTHSSGHDPVVTYTSDNSLRLVPAQEKLIQATLNHPRNLMLGSADELNLLQFICRAIGAKKTLDIGVYTGYSALTIALALPDDGKVYALDITDEFLAIGLPFWKEAGVENKIQFMKAPAGESLQKLIDEGHSGTFDFAFVDADKTGYDNYYELCLKLLRKNGVIAFDNMIWGGKVMNPEVTDTDTVAIRQLTQKLHKDDRVHVSFLAVGDGTYMVMKK